MRRSSFLLFLTVIFIPVFPPPAVWAGRQSATLDPGRPVKKEIKGGQTHRYEMKLNQGEATRITVNQAGVDVKVVLKAADGKEIVEIDRYEGMRGPEFLVFVADQTAVYGVEVSPRESGAPTGTYDIGIEPPRPATPEDRERVRAQRLVVDATVLGNEGSKDAAEKAVRLLDEALAAYRKFGCKYDEALVLVDRGLALSNLGRKREALGDFQQGLEIWKSLADKRGEADALTNSAFMLSDIGEKKAAIEVYLRALVLWREIDDALGEAIALNNVARVYDDIGETEKGLEYFQKALASARRIGERRGEATLLNNIGQVYVRLNDYRTALDYQHQALTLFRDLKNRRGEAMCVNNLGLLYSNLQDHPTALGYFRQALDMAKAGGDELREAITLGNMSQTHTDLNDLATALDYAGKSLELRRKLGIKAGIGTTLNDIGRIQYLGKDFKTARATLDAALLANRETENKTQECISLYGLGLVARETGDGEGSRRFFTQSRDIAKKNRSRQGEAAALAGLALVDRDAGDLAAAQASIEAAIETVEAVRALITQGTARATYFSRIRAYYDLYLDIIMRRHAADPRAGFDRLGLVLSERARARSLVELLAEAGADIRRGIDPDLLARERSVRGRLSVSLESMTRLALRGSSDDRLIQMERDTADLTEEFRAVQAEIRAKSPAYAALTQPAVPAFEDIQRRVVDDDSVLIEFALGETKSWVWVVTRDGMECFELPKREDIETLAIQLHGRISRTAPLSPADAAKAGAVTDRNAAELAKAILGPVAKYLSGKRILIVPDGALHFIPFAALPVPGGSGRIIEAGEVVVLPSAATLLALRREAQTTAKTKKLFVVADPVFSPSDTRVANVTVPPNQSELESERTLERILVQEKPTGEGRATRENAIARLPGTRREAEAIEKLFPGDQVGHLYDFDANFESVTSATLREYAFVHFATHGFVNATRPELSGLALSLVDQRGHRRKGFLLMPDIYNLDLPAELVTLSACETGLGQNLRGEGIVGLTRGFMYAGAKRVLVSLWSVSDRATAELMEEFYRGMAREKLSPGAALRRAQLTLMKKPARKSPYFWAAFVLQGEYR